MRLTMLRPRPVPLMLPTFEARSNGSKIRPRSATGMPMPRSWTDTWKRRSSPSSTTVTSDPAGEYRTALLRRLERM